MSPVGVRPGPDPHPLARPERIPLVVAPAVAGTLLVSAVALSVYKPRGRRRAARGGGGRT